MRILVTGSREWDQYNRLAAALVEASMSELDPRRVTVVHGGARGADDAAGYMGEQMGFNVEVHPAQWRPYGIYNPQAGLLRNTEMVKLGADVCLAFIKDGSAGATDCANKAEAAGIPTRRYFA